MVSPAWGLSPPTRGNHVSAASGGVRLGSIPAHAGEPPPALFPSTRPPVYPRPRGGTMLSAMSESGRTGLSPPTRGNRRALRLRLREARSIPAHAGEPGASARTARYGGVYPRPRGGTVTSVGMASTVEGLSPPTRGNPPAGTSKASRRRSIPAHAGEPFGNMALCRMMAVYPRPRGGTYSIGNKPPSSEGLSPPTRGNPRDCVDALAVGGSIPAHAGEPAPCVVLEYDAAVYPRPRGGTPS